MKLFVPSSGRTARDAATAPAGPQRLHPSGPPPSAGLGTRSLRAALASALLLLPACAAGPAAASSAGRCRRGRWRPVTRSACRPG